MDFYNVFITWTDNAGKSQEVKFNCTKAQVIPQINASLTNDIGPQFSQSIQISIQETGSIRGPLT